MDDMYVSRVPFISCAKNNVATYINKYANLICFDNAVLRYPEDVILPNLFPSRNTRQLYRLELKFANPPFRFLQHLI